MATLSSAVMPSSRKNCWKTKPIARARNAARARSLSFAVSSPSHVHLAGRLALERAHHVQQRRLARARGPYYRPRPRPPPTVSVTPRRASTPPGDRPCGRRRGAGRRSSRRHHFFALAQAVALDLDHVVGVEPRRHPPPCRRRRARPRSRRPGVPAAPSPAPRAHRGCARRRSRRRPALGSRPPGPPAIGVIVTSIVTVILLLGRDLADRVDPAVDGAAGRKVDGDVIALTRHPLAACVQVDGHDPRGRGQARHRAPGESESPTAAFASPIRVSPGRKTTSPRASLPSSSRPRSTRTPAPRRWSPSPSRRRPPPGRSPARAGCARAAARPRRRSSPARACARPAARRRAGTLPARRRGRRANGLG